jgi:hypothetical protein
VSYGEAGSPLVAPLVADPGLAEVARAWATLPEPLRAAVLALVRAWNNAAAMVRGEPGDAGEGEA